MPLYVNSKKDMPNRPHYAVILYSKIHIPGDERSRTNPGHGYPGGYEPQISYLAFENKDILENWLIANKDKSFSVLEVKPLIVSYNATVTIT